MKELSSCFARPFARAFRRLLPKCALQGGTALTTTLGVSKAWVFRCSDSDVPAEFILGRGACYCHCGPDVVCAMRPFHLFVPDRRAQQSMQWQLLTAGSASTFGGPAVRDLQPPSQAPACAALYHIPRHRELLEGPVANRANGHGAEPPNLRAECRVQLLHHPFAVTCTSLWKGGSSFDSP